MNSPVKNALTHAIWIVPLFLWLECGLRPIAEPDVFFYFALVERYLNSGHWPVTDPFAYTLSSDTLMSLHQWLGYWIYYLPYRLLGWAGPIILKTVLVGLFFTIPIMPFFRRKRPLPIYFPLLWTLAIFVSHHRFRERVSLFGDLFIVSLIAGLLWCAELRWFWYLLPALFLVWAQLHPSYPLGWAILIAYFVLRPPITWRRYMLVSLGLCFLTPLLNPLGIEGILYPFRFALNVEPYLRQYVVEWLPLTDSRLFEYRFLYVPFFTFIPLVTWGLWRQRREAPLFEWFLLVLGTALTCKSVRFGLMAEGIFLTLIAATELRKPVVAKVRNWAAISAVALLSILLAIIKVNYSSRMNLSVAERFHIDTAYFPEAAVDYLNQLHPKLHIFNSFGFGGYLAWRWQGDPAIFFHGFSTNFKFYEENYNRAQLGQTEFDQLVQKYDLGVFLLSKLGNDDNFIHLLDKNTRWQKVREDGASVIFAKRDPRVFR